MLNYQSKYIKYKQKYLRLQKINKQIGGEVVLATSDNFEIKKELCNGKYIYIITNNLTKRTIVSDKISNLIFIIDMFEHDYKFYLIKIDDSGNIIPDVESDDESRAISMHINSIITSVGELNIQNMNIFIQIINSTFEHLNILELYKHGQLLNILAAQEEIVKLNALLQAKCPKLTIVFDYMYKLKNSVPIIGDPNYNKLILCLYYKSDEEPINYNCISSITSYYINNTLNINSFTTPLKEGKKYNKFLRAVIIIISGLIFNVTTHMPIQMITSIATNPISALLLINSFGATCNEEDDIEFKKYINERPITHDLIHGFLTRSNRWGLDLIINIDEPHIKRAYEQFHLLIDHIGTEILIDKQLNCE
jgi:hypothetical protein